MATKPIAKMINMITGPFSILPPENGFHI